MTVPETGTGSSTSGSGRSGGSTSESDTSGSGTSGRRPSSDSGRGRALIVAWLLLGALGLVRATPHVAYMGRAFAADGPNTVGEAGKVWFAHRIQTGQPAFAPGDEPPYYPSVHGALLHATVGWVGGVVEASRGELYRIGRGISVLMTVLACLALGALGLRLGIPLYVLAVGGLLWIGTFPLVEHSTSYRPDNWVLMLSAVACWLLSARGTGRRPRLWRLLALVLIPVLAFHVKATGVVLVGAVGLVHLVRRQWRRAVLGGAAQIVLIAASVLILDALSDGTYTDGMRGAVSVPWESGLVLLPHLFRLGDPLIPLFLLGPLPLVFWAARRLASAADGRPGTLFATGDVGSGSAVRVGSGPTSAGFRDTLVAVSCFWAVTFLGYGAATIRAGSAPYYLLEPASYGLLLVLCSIGLAVDAPALRGVPWRGPLMVAFVAVLTAGSTLDAVLRPHAVDISLARTEHVGEHRAALAARVNAQDGTCYSDDPGLNVLLDRPAVIYPLLQLQMIQAGVLSREDLVGPVERHEHRCVIFSGVEWSYRGLRVMPPSFRALVGREYPWVEAVGPYAVHYPEGETLPLSR